MLITLNQKEIEKMILTGLADMGIPHEGATINMVAGRSPTGITAEIKLKPREAVVGIPVVEEGARGSFSGDRAHPAPEAALNVPDKVESKPAVTKEDNIPESEPEDDTSLFDK